MRCTYRRSLERRGNAERLRRGVRQDDASRRPHAADRNGRLRGRVKAGSGGAARLKELNDCAALAIARGISARRRGAGAGEAMRPPWTSLPEDGQYRLVQMSAPAPTKTPPIRITPTPSSTSCMPGPNGLQRLEHVRHRIQHFRHCFEHLGERFEQHLIGAFVALGCPELLAAPLLARDVRFSASSRSRCRIPGASTAWTTRFSSISPDGSRGLSAAALYHR
jgi:hypothetical protein